MPVSTYWYLRVLDSIMESEERRPLLETAEAMAAYGHCRDYCIAQGFGSKCICGYLDALKAYFDARDIKYDFERPSDKYV